ncbi:MAG: hypothetical protein IJF46_01865, partial [Bacteroidaceae bacterium]|nr:hypothetical protein [Bacteroidaceae bacterium]
RNYKDTLYCFVCMECCQGSSFAFVLSRQPRCFPKASAKVQLFLLPPNFFTTFFKKIFRERKSLKKKTLLKISMEAPFKSTTLSAESECKVTAKI